jgi:hypothetical protein
VNRKAGLQELLFWAGTYVYRGEYPRRDETGSLKTETVKVEEEIPETDLLGPEERSASRAAAAAKNQGGGGVARFTYRKSPHKICGV